MKFQKVQYCALLASEVRNQQERAFKRSLSGEEGGREALVP